MVELAFATRVGKVGCAKKEKGASKVTLPPFLRKKAPSVLAGSRINVDAG